MLSIFLKAKSYKLTAREGEAIFLFLSLLLLPLQTRLTLFYPHPFGEWHSGFLYASDLAFCGFFVAVVLGLLLRKTKISFSFFDKKIIGTLAAFFLWAVASAVANGFHEFFAYHLVKLAEGIFLFFYFFFRFPNIFSWKFAGLLLVGDAVLQSVIAAAQFFLQHSLGLWFFRESVLAVGRQDVAQIVVHGTHMIRAYGTFPSPNVLAAFLGVSLFLFYALVWDSADKRFFWPAASVVQGILLLGIFVSFSRAILILFFLVSAGTFLALRRAKHFKEFVIVWLVEVIALSVLFLSELTGRFAGIGLGQDAAINQRLFFNVIATQIIHAHPLFGVGPGNFVSAFQAMLPGLWQPLYQPAHNMFLLIAAEMGIPALLFFVGAISLIFVRAAQMVIRGTRVWYVVLCVSALFIFLVGMEDHLFWTIQQTALLFWVVLGMVGGYGRHLPPKTAEDGGNSKSEFSISN